MDVFQKKCQYSFYTMIITKTNINVFAVNMYLKYPGANEFLHLVVSELLPKRLVSLDKVCIGPWHTISTNQIHDSKLVVTPLTMVRRASLKTSRTFWNSDRIGRSLYKRSAKNQQSYSWQKVTSSLFCWAV